MREFMENVILIYFALSFISLVGWAALCRVGRVWEDENEEKPLKQV